MSGRPSSVGEGGSSSHVSSSDLTHFDAIASIAHAQAGLVLPRDKAPMVLARVSKRMRALKIDTLGAYCAHLDGDAGADERRELVFSLTTNVTSFFREAHHFVALRDDILPALIDRARQGERLRIWSAGCSNGSEPYSLAMTLLEAMPDAARFDVRILATDIDPHVLEVARNGLYPARQLDGVESALRAKHFTEVAATATRGTMFQANAGLRQLISFRELNLLLAWPMKRSFDVIFCRNVVIYFDRATQARLWKRFHAALSPQGHLFLGHSERIDTASFPDFRPAGTTMYRRETMNAVAAGEP